MSTREADGVKTVDLGWSGNDGKYRNEWARRGAAIALERVRGFLVPWARHGAGWGMRLEDLLVSCYLQGFTDARQDAPAIEAPPYPPHETVCP